LASLLFADADDPLGALRWSLAELRRVLDDPLMLRGDPPAFRLPEGAVVDVLALLSPERGRVPAAGLEGEVARGDVVSGMSFPGCPAFETWLSYQRRHVAGVAEAVMGEEALERLAAGDAAGACELAARLCRLSR
jgi:DNA-binding SARP family transcriptional activator